MLGVGGVATIAAWSDPEVVAGTFSSSRFAVESQTANSPWGAHETQNPAALGFAATNMSPGASQYAHIDFRTTAATTAPGQVVPTAVSHDGGALIAFLEYRMAFAGPTTTCAAAAFTGGYTAITVLPAPIPAAPLQPAGSNVQRMCFDVRIVPNAPVTAQGTSANITWQFTATSGS